MPPAKIRTIQIDDSRSDISNTRDRQVANNAYLKKVKGAAPMSTSATIRDNGSTSKEIASMGVEDGQAVTAGQAIGMTWSTVPTELLDSYRMVHNIASPAAFSSPLNQALLTNPGIGKQSPTMIRKRDRRRIPREQLAATVRRHFNGAAVSEIDVVVELAYKVKHQHKAFRMRSIANGVRKT